jgi:hypothetical protein
MHTITFGDHKFNVPGHWNELTGENLLSLASHVEQNIEMEELKLKLLLDFTGIRVIRQRSVMVDKIEHFWVRCGKRKVLVSVTNLAFITAPFLKFFNEIKENKWIVNPMLTRQLLPSIMADKKLYWGPADGLSNITLREFIFTETFLNEFITKNDRSNLDKLIAVLYRPAGKFQPGSADYKGDVREPFNDNIIDDRARYLVALPEAYKKAILWYYEGSKKHIATLYPLVFSEGGGKSDKSTFEVFMTIVDELANNQPSEHERVMDVLLYSALHSLNQRISKIPKDVKV